MNTIIWDFDGTLVDSREKNLNVTRRIIAAVTERDPMQFKALKTLEEYIAANRRSTNWRDFYEREFGLDDGTIDSAGRMWTEYQLDDPTPTGLFDGMKGVFRSLRTIQHGIVSQNARSSIVRVLEENDLQTYFGSVIGYEEVDIRRQKPQPDGLLMCIEQLHGKNDTPVLYVGDHEADILCAQNANAALAKLDSSARVLSVRAKYSCSDNTEAWSVKADFEANDVADIVTIANSLR